MSVACHAWEYPAPYDSAEVDLILAAYRDVRQEQNLRFIEFAKRLTARHPCASALEDPAASVWSHGPLDGVTNRPVYSIGIRDEHLEQVLPFVADTANAVGLTLFEQAQGATYRPDGEVIEFNPAATAPRMSQSGLDMNRVRELLAAQFEQVAADNGFSKVGYNFVRGIEDGWQSLCARVGEAGGAVLAEIAIDIYNYDVMRLCHTLDPERRAGDASGRAFSLSVYEFLGDPEVRLFVRVPSDFLHVAKALKPIVGTRMMRLADESTTLIGLDRVMNTSRTQFRHFPLNHLVVSRLAGSAEYGVLYKNLLTSGAVSEELLPWFGNAYERLSALDLGEE